MAKFFQTDGDYYPHLKKTKKEDSMFKKWIQNFLGISDIKSKLHNIDGDLTSIMEHQLTQEKETIPIDPPLTDKNSP